MKNLLTSRAHLLNALAEAAELEHSLMCMYLYALFSLKTSPEDGLPPHELGAVRQWREVMLGICVEEMGHLALVNNLITSLGGAGHFGRPRFPVRPGPFPAEFVLSLTPFNADTLKHFIFLERPSENPVEDSPVFFPESYGRDEPGVKLMAHLPDYATVGELYETVEKSLRGLAEKLGEPALFCGPASVQISPDEVNFAGLTVVTNLASASAAIRAIVEQGEGARSVPDSHFEKFSRIAEEYEAMLGSNPAFCASRDVARNPVTHRALPGQECQLVQNPAAVAHIDLANAIYALMLQLLAQTYATQTRPAAEKAILLGTAFSLMKTISLASDLVTATPGAGMSFDLLRYGGTYERSLEKRLLLERVDEILARVAQLGAAQTPATTVVYRKLPTQLQSVRKALGRLAP